MSMDRRLVLAGSSLVVCVAVAACGTSTPAQPSGAATSSSGTASVGAPVAMLPANGTQLKFSEQPVTLSAQNGVVSDSSTPTYTFEVATDSAFSNKVQTKDGVAQGSGPQTSVKLDALAESKDYYWHVRAQGGGTTGVFTAPLKFSIGPAVTINAPVVIFPLNGAQTGARPAFTINNATVQGPAGAITYKFEVSTSSTFTSIVASASVPAGQGQTTFTPDADLPINVTMFWRATGSDASNAVTGAASAPQSFTTSLAIDLTKVVYLLGPNLSTWTQTGKIISVEQDGNESVGGPMCIAFTDPGWPDTPWIYAKPGDPPGFGIFGNQWYFANIGGIWYGGPGEWLYRGAGTCKAGQGTTTIGRDAGFGEPFTSWQPKVGELVGYAVSASARALPAMSTVQERTDVVLVPWRDTSRGSTLQAPMFGVVKPSQIKK
jgi:hypothetical protein